MGLGALTMSLPYWPMTRIERPDDVVTALIVSDVATEPGLLPGYVMVAMPVMASMVTAAVEGFTTPIATLGSMLG